MQTPLNSSLAPSTEKSPSLLVSCDHLLILRGLAALAVFVFHFNGLGIPRPSLGVGRLDLTWLLSPHAYIAVWIFFCLSGYMMGKAFFTRRYTADGQGILTFYWNRIVRIVPLTYFTILITAIFVSPGVFQVANWQRLLHLLTFTYTLTDQELIFTWRNQPLWSLSTEMHFYLLVPFFFMLCHRLKLAQSLSRWVIITGLVVAGAWLIRAWLWLHIDRANLFAYFEQVYCPLYGSLDIFLVGFLLHPLMHWLQQRRRLHTPLVTILEQGWAKWLGWLAIATLFATSAHYLYTNSLSPTADALVSRHNYFLWPALTYLCTACFIFIHDYPVYGDRRQPLSLRGIRLHPWRGLETLGVLSFGLYVWHQPIMVSLPSFSLPSAGLSYWGNGLFQLTLTLLFATITYLRIERPATHWKRFPWQATMPKRA